MKLVIVESPTKSKTISHYLGDGYRVEASVGHIRDLAISGKGGLGVDVENNFEPKYVVNADKKEVVSELKKLAKDSTEVILATDPDREGEAIAWHLASVLDLPIETTKRLEFHEITKKSITSAISSPRTINLDLVHSQEARRIIDRIIGFKLSGLMKQKIRSKSAGRVQSVTLKMIVEREKEIEAFVPEEFYSIKGSILKDEVEYPLTFTKFDGKAGKITSKEVAEEITSCKKEKLVVRNIEVSQKRVSSKEAYRTSTLQQDAINKLGFSSREVTNISQQLYEGVEINGESVGLITYIRTDSTSLSESFINEAKMYITTTFGKEFFQNNRVKKTVKGAQEAHEAIRPTDVAMTPALAKNYLNDKQYKLYKLIYERAIGSLMKEKVVETTTITFANSRLEFELKGSKVVENGYNILKLDEEEDPTLPTFNIGEEYKIKSLTKKQDFTKPPARFTEAKVIALMEEKGIGRPSTYSSTIQTLITRKYVSKVQNVLKPTEQGVLTSNVLNKYFPDLMNTNYTAEMETNLDKISEGEEDEVKVIREFYDSFKDTFDEAKEIIYKEPLKTTGEICPQCGSELVIRHGRYGDFVGCANFPDCNYIKKEKTEVEEVGRECPQCGSPLLYRRNKIGNKFIGCSNFPKCKYIEGLENNDAETKICPDCGHNLVVRYSRGRPFWGCSNYPNCKHMEPYKKNAKKD